MRVFSKSFIYSIIYIFYSFSFCNADIDLPFSTTFDCMDVIQKSTVDCDGLIWGGDWYFGEYRSQITVLANNGKGEGKKGFRTWDGDGVNVDTGPIAAVFPSPQKELWIRWYQRHQYRYQWKSTTKGFLPLYNKNVYLFTGKQGNAAIAEYYYDKYVIVSQGTPNYYQVMTADGDGWTGVMRDSVSDGEFHCFEIHVKMDTNSSNGIGQIWIDGVLKASNQSVDWSGGSEVARAGWTYFKLGENQSNPNNGSVMYVDYDDLAVYNLTPPKKDSNGNPFIGPLKLILPPQDFK